MPPDEGDSGPFVQMNSSTQSRGERHRWGLPKVETLACVELDKV
jgi:hypothetical protein